MTMYRYGLYGELPARYDAQPSWSNDFMDRGLILWLEFLDENDVLWVDWVKPEEFTWEPLQKFAFDLIPADVAPTKRIK
jgi:hypothetical protein